MSPTLATPAISIIVPVFNAGSFLQKAVESIQNQPGDFECILVDDGSTDASGYLCDEISKNDTRFRVIHQENSGAYIARLRGIREASGEYLTFLDADDLFFSNAIPTMLRSIQFCSTQSIHIFQHLPVPPTSDSSSPHSVKIEDGISSVSWNHAVSLLLRYKYSPSMWAKLWPHSAFDSAIPKMNLTIGEDLYCSLEALLNTHLLSIIHRDTVYGYRNTPGSAMNAGDFRHRYDRLSTEVEALLRRHGVESIFHKDCLAFKTRNVLAASWKENRPPPLNTIRALLSAPDWRSLDIPPLEMRILRMYAASPVLASSCLAIRLCARKIIQAVRKHNQ